MRGEKEVSLWLGGVPFPADGLKVELGHGDGPPVLTLDGTPVKAGVPVRLTVIYDGPAGGPPDVPPEGLPQDPP